MLSSTTTVLLCILCSDKIGSIHWKNSKLKSIITLVMTTHLFDLVFFDIIFCFYRAISKANSNTRYDIIADIMVIININDSKNRHLSVVREK